MRIESRKMYLRWNLCDFDHVLPGSSQFGVVKPYHTRRCVFSNKKFITAVTRYRYRYGSMVFSTNGQIFVGYSCVMTIFCMGVYSCTRREQDSVDTPTVRTIYSTNSARKFFFSRGTNLLICTRTMPTRKTSSPMPIQEWPRHGTRWRCLRGGVVIKTMMMMRIFYDVLLCN